MKIRTVKQRLEKICKKCPDLDDCKKGKIIICGISYNKRKTKILQDPKNTGIFEY